MVDTKEKSLPLPNREALQVPSPEIQQYLDLVTTQRDVEEKTKNSPRNDAEFLLASENIKLQRYYFLLELDKLKARHSETDLSSRLNYYLKNLFTHMQPEGAVLLLAEHCADLIQNHIVALNTLSEQEGAHQLELISTFCREVSIRSTKQILSSTLPHTI